jgi:hypothetical protein
MGLKIEIPSQVNSFAAHMHFFLPAAHNTIDLIRAQQSGRPAHSTGPPKRPVPGPSRCVGLQFRRLTGARLTATFL